MLDWFLLLVLFYNIVLIAFLVVTMELPDSEIIRNRDWDPSYLMELFQHDFYEFY